MTRTRDPAATLRALPAGGTFKTLRRIVPLGSLQARRRADGAVLLAWRFSVTVDGVERESREQFGVYDPALPPKSLKPSGNRYSLAAAVRHAESLAEQHAARRREGGLLAIRAARQAQEEAFRASAASDASKTLSHLMGDYADHLQRLGRSSHRQVRSVARRHIDTNTQIATTAALLVTPEDVADLMRAANDSGKPRTANKLRSYVRAAYEVAKSARIDASVPAAFKGYGVKSNPAAETKVIDATKGRPRTIRALSPAQLRAYWNIIRAVPGKKAALLRLHLLTGGQRIAQLLRLRVADISDDLITIYDGKGRSRALRPHAVPLIPAARRALDEAATTTGEFALSSDGGDTHISESAFDGWAKEIIGAAGDQAKPLAGFMPKLVRSGVETALAAFGIDKEVRGRLQSHGISGVQDAHYNAHDYLPQKRRALETLYRMLNAPDQMDAPSAARRTKHGTTAQV
jgi:integrase